MGEIALLSFLVFFPAFGAILLLLVRNLTAGGDDKSEARIAFLSGLFISAATFIISLIALAFFDAEATVPYQLVEDIHWFGGSFSESRGVFEGGIRYKMGVDGMSILLVLLTTFLTPLCFIASWGSIKHRVTEYVAAFLILESLMLGVFCALDLVLFYVFFEAGLIPMFIIIGIWGGQDRVYAAFKFFLYTLLGSLFMLVAIVAIFLNTGTTDVQSVQQIASDAKFMASCAGSVTDTGGVSEACKSFASSNADYGLTRASDADAFSAKANDLWFFGNVQLLFWLAFFASFAVKLPMWPVHTWLPDAHVQAPTAGSVILAGVLLKMGGYGLLRFSLPLFPDASEFFQPMVFALSVIAIVYASLVAFRQTDMKKLIAYSSVAHMGFVTLGIFSFNEVGIQGAIFQMISHGVISGALFLIVGVIYDRMHTREIAFYGGLVGKMPIYATVFMLFTMANVGLPGTSGFIGEILTMVGSFQVNTYAAAGAALGVIFSAVYMLTLYRRTVFGVMNNPKLEGIKDLTGSEIVIFVPLIIATIVLGVFPALIFDLTEASVQQIQAMSSGLMGS